MKKAAFLAFLMLFLGQSLIAQDVPCDSKVAFVDKNMIDYTISVRSLDGKITDSSGVAVPSDCVALFTPDRSKLVQAIKASENGEFSIRAKDGDYWLVVQDPQRAFCPAVAKVKLRKSARKKNIAVHMKARGIDDCSYCEAR